MLWFSAINKPSFALVLSICVLISVNSGALHVNKYDYIVMHRTKKGMPPATLKEKEIKAQNDEGMEKNTKMNEQNKKLKTKKNTKKNEFKEKKMTRRRRRRGENEMWPLLCSPVAFR